MSGGHCQTCGYGVMLCECAAGAKVVFYWSDRALAAAAQRAKTRNGAECEASQSGPKGNAQNQSPKGVI